MWINRISCKQVRQGKVDIPDNSQPDEIYDCVPPSPHAVEVT